MSRTEPHNLHLPQDPDLGVTVNLPPALTGGRLKGLPSYATTDGYLVDKYPACPASWPRGPSSYFVPVSDGRGMWLDFNRLRRHKHHVAVVVSIQGINPLTGRKADKLELERYADDPGTEKWLRGYQNYLSTVSTPEGMMWIDGFIGADGEVRQYVFTKDESKGVAAQLIGVDRVFAIGVAFFTSKEPRPPEPMVVHSHTTHLPIWHLAPIYYGVATGSSADMMYSPQNTSSMEGSQYINNAGVDIHLKTDNSEIRDTLLAYTSKDTVTEYKFSSTGIMRSASGSKSLASHYTEGGSMKSAMSRSRKLKSPGVSTTVTDTSMSEPVQESVKLELAAGARISQTLYRDHTERSFWNERPAGTVVINYCPQEMAAQIIAAGEVGDDEGFLAKLKVGVEAASA